MRNAKGKSKQVQTVFRKNTRGVFCTSISDFKICCGRIFSSEIPPAIRKLLSGSLRSKQRPFSFQLKTGRTVSEQNRVKVSHYTKRKIDRSLYQKWLVYSLNPPSR